MGTVDKIPFHLVHRDFYDDVISATDTLLSSKLHSRSRKEQIIIMQSWANKIAHTYAIPAPAVSMMPDHGLYLPANYMLAGHAVLLKRAGYITLMHLFRHCMQASLQMQFDSEILAEHDAFGWSLSLYYRVKPVTFKRLVLEGKVYGMKPQDLIEESAESESDA